MKVSTVAKRTSRLLTTWPRVDKARGQVKAASGQLDRDLAREYHRHVRKLHASGNQPGETESLCEMLLLLSRMRDGASRIRKGDPADPEALGRFTREFTEELLEAFDREPRPQARLSLTETLKIVTTAQLCLPPARSPAAKTRTVQIPSEFLYQAYSSLFPAERMLLAAGRNEEGVTSLTALFEVTGKAHSAHVQADPGRLARALISMDMAESFLLGWFHSHPGRGAGATTPSSIDRRQQDEWLKDYSPDLVGLIIVEDGHFRLWGPAVEDGQIRIKIVGSGFERKGEDHVYRLHV